MPDFIVLICNLASQEIVAYSLIRLNINFLFLGIDDIFMKLLMDGSSFISKLNFLLSLFIVENYSFLTVSIELK